MRWNSGKQPGRYRRIGLSAGLNVIDLADPSADRAAINWVDQLIAESGVQLGLSHHGVRQEHIVPLAQLAMKDSCHLTNPIRMEEEDFRGLYQTLL